jgi:hypothetical protein
VKLVKIKIQRKFDLSVFVVTMKILGSEEVTAFSPVDVHVSGECTASMFRVENMLCK